MSAIARYYKAKGFAVSGYDKTPSQLTEALQSEGIDVHYTDDTNFIPADKENTMVVYTPAIPSDLKELRYVMDNGYSVVKRSRMLGEITRGQRTLAVAGTHGKTTTSTLIGHIFHDSGEGCSAFLGGISKNYDSNLILSTNDVVVAEADEFDRSFLQLFPEIAVITAMDADHLDIYGDIEHVHEAFRAFASQVSGTLVKKLGLPLGPSDTKARILTYHATDAAADFHAENIRTDECGYCTYDLVHPDGVLHDVRPGVPGKVNMENSIAACAVALAYGLDGGKIRSAVASFQGVRRRFDVHVNRPGCTYIDDYAHHPAELAAAIASIRGMFPSRHITAVFQPHLYTRTRDFAPEFAKALSSGIDKLILTDIYPARELPIEGVSSNIIFDAVTLPDKVLLRRDQLPGYLENEKIDILITFGAGDIDRFIPQIKQMLENR